MWTVEKLTKECEKISKSMNDVFTCPIYINGRLSRTLGRVMYTFRPSTEEYYVQKMEFSKSFLERAQDEDVIETIKHEWAHYYVTKTTKENHGHDKVFKAICAKIDCASGGMYIQTADIKGRSRYEVYCPTCDKVVAHYQRMCKTLKNLDSCTCKKCKGGNLVLKQNWWEW